MPKPQDIDQQCIDALLDLFNFDGKPLNTLLPVCTNDFILPALAKHKCETFTPPRSEVLFGKIDAPDHIRHVDSFFEWWKEQVVSIKPMQFELAIIYCRPQDFNKYGGDISLENYARLILQVLDLPIDTVIGTVPSELVDVRYQEKMESALCEARSILTDKRTGDVEIAPDENYVLFSRQ